MSIKSLSDIVNKQGISAFTQGDGAPPTGPEGSDYTPIFNLEDLPRDEDIKSSYFHEGLMLMVDENEYYPWLQIEAKVPDLTKAKIRFFIEYNWQSEIDEIVVNNYWDPLSESGDIYISLPQVSTASTTLEQLATALLADSFISENYNVLIPSEPELASNPDAMVSFMYAWNPDVDDMEPVTFIDMENDNPYPGFKTGPHEIGEVYIYNDEYTGKTYYIQCVDKWLDEYIPEEGSEEEGYSEIRHQWVWWEVEYADLTYLVGNLRDKYDLENDDSEVRQTVLEVINESLGGFANIIEGEPNNLNDNIFIPIKVPLINNAKFIDGRGTESSGPTEIMRFSIPKYSLNDYPEVLNITEDNWRNGEYFNVHFVDPVDYRGTPDQPISVQFEEVPDNGGWKINITLATDSEGNEIADATTFNAIENWFYENRSTLPDGFGAIQVTSHRNTEFLDLVDWYNIFNYSPFQAHRTSYNPYPDGDNYDGSAIRVWSSGESVGEGGASNDMLSIGYTIFKAQAHPAKVSEAAIDWGNNAKVARHGRYWRNVSYNHQPSSSSAWRSAFSAHNPASMLEIHKFVGDDNLQLNYKDSPNMPSFNGTGVHSVQFSHGNPGQRIALSWRTTGFININSEQTSTVRFTTPTGVTIIDKTVSPEQEVVQFDMINGEMIVMEWSDWSQTWYIIDKSEGAYTATYTT